MEQNFPQPIYIPENSVELDASMLRVDNKHNFKNKFLSKILSDDIVRSYLSDLEIKALWHFAACYEGLCDASTGKYEGVYDNAAEHVLTDILFIVNIARSRAGVNVRVIKGRNPLEELRKESFMDRARPFQNNQNQPQQQPQQENPQYGPQFNPNGRY